MIFQIIIPAHNEEHYLSATLNSLLNQSHKPAQIIVVNDGSTDGTQQIIEDYTARSPIVHGIHLTTGNEHLPGSKVISAFQKGLDHIRSDFDVICKFDADLIFPSHYLETLKDIFSAEPRTGMAGGFCYIQSEDEEWILENLTNPDHIRGALKAYKRACFEAIGGLKSAMGWDTVDELLARYHGWKIVTEDSLKVKHLKPTGAGYKKAAARKQGEAFRRMRYRLLLTIIASAKLAVRKRNIRYFFSCMGGFFKSPTSYLVNRDEGKFIRKHRWKGVWGRLTSFNSRK